jgi:hypothetical protein
VRDHPGRVHRADGRRTIAFCEAPPGGVRQQRMVPVMGRRQIEQCLQQAMDMGAREQQSKRIPMRNVI